MTYVKLYLVKNRKCLGKAKTTLSNKRTLNPLFQQQLTFHEDYHGCILQVSAPHATSGPKLELQRGARLLLAPLIPMRLQTS